MIVVLAHHDALILTYEFLVLVLSGVWVFSCILTAKQLEIQSPCSAIIYRIHIVFSCSFGLSNPNTAWYDF
jgi:hypothetical protein